MFSIIVIHEQGDASVFKAGYKTEQAAKIQRGRAASKYAHETFIVNEDATAELRVTELNNGDIKVSEDGKSFEIVKKVAPVAKTAPKKTGGKKTVGQVPPNILHMIAVTTGNANKQWRNIAARNYGYQEA